VALEISDRSRVALRCLPPTVLGYYILVASVRERLQGNLAIVVRPHLPFTFEPVDRSVLYSLRLLAAIFRGFETVDRRLIEASWTWRFAAGNFFA